MQEVLSQGFYEMSEDEMNEIDGGVGRFGDWVLVGGAAGFIGCGVCLVVAPALAPAVLIGGFVGGFIDGGINAIVD